MALMDDIVAASVLPGTLLLWWLGQGGFAFKNSLGKVLFCDPYLSDCVAALDGPDWARLFPPPIDPAGAVVDLVICTHEHPDHADPQTIPALMAANPQCLLAGPPSVAALARGWGLPQDRFARLERGGTLQHAGFVIHARYTDHTPDSISLVIEADGNRVAHTGDSLYSTRLAAELAEAAPTALITVINGKLGNMSAQHAARLAAEIDARQVIPCHYGMFRLNTADPAEFLLEMATKGRGGGVTLPHIGVPITMRAGARQSQGVLP
jgi:L-ascorbate 6-phosphate lactonase